MGHYMAITYTYHTVNQKVADFFSQFLASNFKE